VVSTPTRERRDPLGFNTRRLRHREFQPHPGRHPVHRDYVICLDCGYRGKTLRRHITTQHGLSRDEYLNRWGLRRDHPLTAPAYSEQRSTVAKALGLGRKPKAQVAQAATR
jgi:predicted transcriptional regulator